jgi:hypothetical protein
MYSWHGQRLLSTFQGCVWVSDSIWMWPYYLQSQSCSWQNQCWESVVHCQLLLPGIADPCSVGSAFEPLRETRPRGPPGFVTLQTYAIWLDLHSSREHWHGREQTGLFSSQLRNSLFLCTLNIHHHVHKSPPLCPDPSQFNPIQIFTIIIPKGHFHHKLPMHAVKSYLQCSFFCISMRTIYFATSLKLFPS